MTKANKKKTQKLSSVKRKRLIFYSLMIALPLLQFLIFYVFVNFNSIILSFKEYDLFTETYSFAGFKNYQRFFIELTSVQKITESLKNSLLLYVIGFLTGSIPTIVFSFYIYKKKIGATFFRLMLFAPQIISSLALVLMFMYFSERAIPALVLTLFKQTITINIDFGLVMFYSIMSSFGTTILLYVSSMSSIPESLVEVGKLEGISPIKELIYITIPMIYPIFITFVITGISSIFLSQMSLFDFFGLDAANKDYTFGYYLYRTIKHHDTTIADYPYLSAIGVVLTFVTLPVVLLVKKLMEKYGPSAD